jgi:hypothetical protein
MKKFLIFFKVVFFVGLFFSIFIFNSYAEKAQSSHYNIVIDSLNNAGGDNQISSSGYKMKDTAGEMGTGESASTNYKLRAGYRQMDNAFYISISSPDDVNLGTLSGFTGGTATGALTWTVITDNPAGYNLSVKAGTVPTLSTGTYNIADYTPVGGTTTPDYNWSIGSAASEFGFAPYNSASQIQKFKDNGSSCNNGSTITDLKCWFGFATSDTQVANRTSSTTGENTKINLQTQINTANGYQENGTYTATITATAVAN